MWFKNSDAVSVALLDRYRVAGGVYSGSLFALRSRDDFAFWPGFGDVFCYLIRVEQLIEFLDGFVVVVSSVQGQHVGVR